MTVLTDISDYVAGDTLRLEFTITDQAGVAVDLTGATGRWGIASGTLAAPGSVIVSGTVTFDVAAHKAIASLARGAFVSVGAFVHELEVTLASTDSYTVAQGVLISGPAVFVG